mmetsp:Transcript_21428/g.51589  ORF Transcript_21428/g.51589 Transcript_21428/m.51589 type:complete len:242 (-) Transcript_21428:151-876(-)
MHPSGTSRLSARRPVWTAEPLSSWNDAFLPRSNDTLTWMSSLFASFRRNARSTFDSNAPVSRGVTAVTGLPSTFFPSINWRRSSIATTPERAAGPSTPIALTNMLLSAPTLKTIPIPAGVGRCAGFPRVSTGATHVKEHAPSASTTFLRNFTPTGVPSLPKIFELMYSAVVLWTDLPSTATRQSPCWRILQSAAAPSGSMLLMYHPPSLAIWNTIPIPACFSVPSFAGGEARAARSSPPSR